VTKSDNWASVERVTKLSIFKNEIFFKKISIVESIILISDIESIILTVLIFLQSYTQSVLLRIYFILVLRHFSFTYLLHCTYRDMNPNKAIFAWKSKSRSPLVFYINPSILTIHTISNIISTINTDSIIDRIRVTFRIRFHSKDFRKLFFKNSFENLNFYHQNKFF